MKEKRQYKQTNSTAIVASAYWYPFTETGSPSELERDQYFPLKSMTIENKSTQPITIILDPISGTSTKEFELANGKTISLENRDLFTFHQIAIKNTGVIDIGIGELKSIVRNY